MRLDYCFLTENEDDDDFSKVLADNREVSQKAAADEPEARADEQGPPEENEDDVAEIFGDWLDTGSLAVSVVGADETAEIEPPETSVTVLVMQ